MTEKPIIATATSTVSNGKSSTSTLNYSQGYSRSDLIPGNTYQINGKYQENNHYEYNEDIGTLEMLKCSTTTTLSGNSQITYGENIQLNITVKENINNSSISRGTLKLYNGNDLVQTTIITNQNTSISYTPSTTGIHDLYVIYEDSGVEYNTSTSNHLSLTVAKIQTHISLKNTDMAENGIVGYIGDSFTIPFSLLDENENELENEPVTLYDYNGSVLNTISTSSSSECTYSLSDELANYQTIRLGYEGTNEYDSCILEIPIIVNSSIIQISDIAYEIDNVLYNSNSEERPLVRWNEEESGDIYMYITVYDENGDEVQSGELDWYYSIPEEGSSEQEGITTTAGGIYFPMYNIYDNYPEVSEIHIYPVWVGNEDGIYEDSRENPESNYIRVHKKYVYDSIEPEDWINVGYYKDSSNNDFNTWSVR